MNVLWQWFHKGSAFSRICEKYTVPNLFDDVSTLTLGCRGFLKGKLFMVMVIHGRLTLTNCENMNTCVWADLLFAVLLHVSE